MTKRALISVSDKRGVVELAKRLRELGWEIISTGGTGKKIAEAGVPVTPIREITGMSEDDYFSHRMSTISYPVGSALLYVRGDKEHEAEAKEIGVLPIDLVVCNLYPFGEAVAKEPGDIAAAVRNIDIGGPTMVRAAAKNHAGHQDGPGVTIVVDPADYDMVLAFLEKDGKIPLDFRRKLAVKAFELTARYDLAIWQHLSGLFEEGEVFYRVAKLVQQCRYGENPHQEGAFYSFDTNDLLALDKFVQLAGKEMSFNNFNDLHGALRALCHCRVSLKKELGEERLVAIGVKHGNPCGAAFGTVPTEVLAKMLEGDLTAIFGGIIITNFSIGIEEAKIIKKHKMEEGMKRFLEIVAAPSFSRVAFEYFAKAKDLRLLVNDALRTPHLDQGESFLQVRGGILAQNPNNRVITSKDFKVVTEKSPSENQMLDMVFARALNASSKSNNVLAVKDNMLIGNGTGQMDRVRCIQIMAMREPERFEGAVISSDALFPFPDSIDEIARLKAGAILSVEGSKKDAEVIAAANQYNIPMVFIEFRQFLH